MCFFVFSFLLPLCVLILQVGFTLLVGWGTACKRLLVVSIMRVSQAPGLLINSGIAASIGVGYKFPYFFETQLDLLKGEDVTVGASNDTVINNNYAAVASVQAVLPLTQKINLDAGIGAKFNYFHSKQGFTLKQGGHQYVVNPGEQVGQIAPEVTIGVSKRVVDSLRVMAISRYDFPLKSPESAYSFELALRWLV